MKINVLSTEIANMIAAGEVVERPASVVKELAENSVDAGSTSITIEIKKGGMTFIRVSDNGCGIEAEDVVTAFKRHATSKIKTENDLNSIYTLGFRGEALASIAAVSKTDIFTKPAKQKTGTAVSIQGGEVFSESESGCPDGTTITVRDLFYNTPARMKFLKNDATETSYVSDVVNKLILSHPEISFKLINNGKITASSPGDGLLKNAVYAVFGKDYTSNMIPVDSSDDGIRVSGYAGNAAISRKDRRHQIFYINGRNITSRLMSAALGEAFKNTLMTGKFPSAVLNLEINTNLVDVNVHPTKMEVRFSDDKKIYEAVYWAVKNALSQDKYIPEMSMKTDSHPKKVVPSPAYDGYTTTNKAQINMLRDSYINSIKPSPMKQYIMPDRETGGEIEEGSLKSKKSPAAELHTDEEHTPPERFSENAFSNPPNISGDAAQPNAYETNIPAAAKPLSRDEAPNETSRTDVPSDKAGVSEKAARKAAEEKKSGDTSQDDAKEEVFADTAKRELKENIDYRIVGQIFGTYIIVQTDSDMLLIDQHAAHERLYFEEFMTEYKAKSFSPQILLVPVVIDLMPAEFDIAAANRDFFASLGYETDIFGDRSIIIRQIPYAEDEHIVKDTVNEIISLLSNQHADIKKELLEEALHTMACKRAVKGNHELTQQETEALVQRVMSLSDINTCPHGRPIMIRLSKYSLEKQFKRIV